MKKILFALTVFLMAGTAMNAQKNVLQLKWLSAKKTALNA